jgi:hypothetical protein
VVEVLVVVVVVLDDWEVERDGLDEEVAEVLEVDVEMPPVSGVPVRIIELTLYEPEVPLSHVSKIFPE